MRRAPQLQHHAHVLNGVENPLHAEPRDDRENTVAECRPQPRQKAVELPISQGPADANQIDRPDGCGHQQTDQQTAADERDPVHSCVHWQQPPGVVSTGNFSAVEGIASSRSKCPKLVNASFRPVQAPVHVPTLMTTRPRTWPFRICGASVSTSLSRAVRDGGGQLRHIEIARQSLPRLHPPRPRALHGIDARKRHAAQNEGRNRRRQIHPLRQSARGNRAAIARRGQHVRQRFRARRNRPRRPIVPSPAAGRRCSTPPGR